MKYIGKHSKRKRHTAKYYIINSITFVMAVICLFSLAAVDSESWIPFIAFIISCGWCCLYMLVNFGDCE